MILDIDFILRIIAIAFFIIGIALSFVFEYSKKFRVKSNWLKIGVVYGLFIAVFLLSIYLSADNIKEFLYVTFCISFVIALVIGFAFIIDYKFKGNINIITIGNFMAWVAFFFLTIHINKHLIKPFPHFWMCIIFIEAIRQLYQESNKNKKNVYKILAANVLGMIFLIFLFNYYSESYMGTSKQEYAVRKYMIENEGYKPKDIVDLDGLSGKRDEYFVVIVKMNSGKHCIYHYKDGVVQKWKEI